MAHRKLLVRIGLILTTLFGAYGATAVAAPPSTDRSTSSSLLPALTVDPTIQQAFADSIGHRRIVPVRLCRRKCGDYARDKAGLKKGIHLAMSRPCSPWISCGEMQGAINQYRGLFHTSRRMNKFLVTLQFRAQWSNFDCHQYAYPPNFVGPPLHGFDCGPWHVRTGANNRFVTIARGHDHFTTAVKSRQSAVGFGYTSPAWYTNLMWSFYQDNPYMLFGYYQVPGHGKMSALKLDMRDGDCAAFATTKYPTDDELAKQCARAAFNIVNNPGGQPGKHCAVHRRFIGRYEQIKGRVSYGWLAACTTGELVILGHAHQYLIVQKGPPLPRAWVDRSDDSVPWHLYMRCPGFNPLTLPVHEAINFWLSMSLPRDPRIPKWCGDLPVF